MTSTLAVANWQEAVLLAASNILTQIFAALPTLLAALVLFLVGLVFARWGKSLTVKLLEAIRLSKVVKKSGLEQFLKKAEITLKVEEFFGNVVRWLIILIFFVAVVNVLGLTAVSQVLTSILNFIPRVVSAVLVLTASVLLAGLVESLVKGALAQIDLKTSRLLGKLSSYLVVIFGSLAAINELGIARTLINTLFIGFVAMMALGIGLAIGLGAKDLVARILNDWYENFKKEVKD